MKSRTSNKKTTSYYAKVKQREDRQSKKRQTKKNIKLWYQIKKIEFFFYKDLFFIWGDYIYDIFGLRVIYFKCIFWTLFLRFYLIWKYKIEIPNCQWQFGIGFKLRVQLGWYDFVFKIKKIYIKRFLYIKVSKVLLKLIVADFIVNFKLIGLILIVGLDQFVSIIKSRPCSYIIISCVITLILFIGGYFALIEFCWRVTGL